MQRTDVNPPYNHKSHPVDEKGPDFKAVVDWLVANGAPRPRVFIEGGAESEEIHLLVFSGKTTDFTADGSGLVAMETNGVCNDPGMALQELARQFNFGNRDAEGHVVEVKYPVPTPAAHVVVNPGTEKALTPIGVYDESNGHYDIAYGWINQLHMGEIIDEFGNSIADPATFAGTKLKVTKHPMPFGPTGYLEVLP